jgi:polyhydroxyalkanoate synthesis repressor PhaR
MIVAKKPEAPTDDVENGADAAVTVIKKYANRRLYNTKTSSYVTLDHLSEMVREGADFVVQDAKTGEDITRSVLTQIIFEQESRGQALLPVQFLRRLIRFYGDQMQAFVPSYLDMSMETFQRSQERWRDQLTRTFGTPNAVQSFEEQARQNMALFEQAMRVWAPFAAGYGPGQTPPVPGAAPPAAPGDAPESAAEGEALDDLRRQMALMQAQLDQLTKQRKT